MVKNRKTVLMVMVDALRHDYINPDDAPFLHDMASRGTSGALIPSFGFEPDAAYFSGLDPEECNGGTQYWRNPDEQVFYVPEMLRLLEHVPVRKWRKYVRKSIQYLAQLRAHDPLTRQLAPCNWIPLDKLEQFSFPMKMNASDEGFTSSPTIFDVVRRKGEQFFYHGHPSYRVGIRHVERRYLEEESGDNVLAFLFIADLDGIGHRFGPESRERRNALKRVDAGLKNIHEAAMQRYDQVDLLVFGDHGMAAVNRTIDIGHILSANLLDTRQDSYFLDSTFARFWVADPQRRQKLVSLLNQTDGGHVLNDEEIIRYRIRHPHNYFGDVIFAVDNHAIIHPSFYNLPDDVPKGMHGYLPGCPDNESAFVLSTREAGKGNLGRVDMRRIFPTLISLLDAHDCCSIPHQLTSITE